jgi:hypothetical protein
MKESDDEISLFKISIRVARTVLFNRDRIYSNQRFFHRKISAGSQPEAQSRTGWTHHCRKNNFAGQPHKSEGPEGNISYAYGDKP